MITINEALQAFPANVASACGIALSMCLAVHYIPYFVDPHGLRAFPGPFFARFTDAWMALTVSRGRRSEEIHQLHQELGTFVRLAPNHISISSHEALSTVYGHSAGTLKSEFYDAFISFNPGLFSTRSRAVHARKRRIVAHMFAPQSVRAFEPTIREHLSELCAQWDKLCERQGSGEQGGMLGASTWSAEQGRVWLDGASWINYLLFDTIGHLAFGQMFGMVRAGSDNMKVVKSVQAGMDAYDTSIEHCYETEEIAAISTLATRTKMMMILAVIPSYWRPLVQRLPWFSQGTTTGRQLKGMAVGTVARRLAASALGNGEVEKQDDMLQRLLEGRDEEDKPMAAPELSTEALTLLVAGSDTVSTSATAIIYYLSCDRCVQAKLQAELDAAVGADADFAPYDAIKHLPYLDAVINEGLRVYSALGGGLPRIVPEGGVTILGQTFKEGTVLSVPLYTVHRNTDVWGADAEKFRPERWLEGDTKELYKAFAPFSLGPRACVGRNLAQMELLILTATLFHRYDTVVRLGQTLQTHDAFIRKLFALPIGIKRRHL